MNGIKTMIIAMSEMERKEYDLTNEKIPNTMAMDDFNYYISANDCVISEMSEEKFIRMKNNFLMALEKELTNYYKWANKR